MLTKSITASRRNKYCPKVASSNEDRCRENKFSIDISLTFTLSPVSRITFEKKLIAWTIVTSYSIDTLLHTVIWWLAFIYIYKKNNWFISILQYNISSSSSGALNLCTYSYTSCKKKYLCRCTFRYAPCKKHLI